MARTRRLFAALAVAALAVLPVAPAFAAPTAPAVPAAPADVDDFEFRVFHATYTLARTADRHAALEVVETLVAEFPTFDQNRGILRAIPDYYGDVHLQTRVLGVTDGQGADVPYEVQSDGGFTVLVIDDDTFKHGATTYVIHYTQVDTIRHFADTGADEFYWDVNGTGWAQPFRQVSAEVVLDAELAAAMTEGAACYAGPAGATTACGGGVAVADRADGSKVVTASARNLAPGENLSIAVPFAAGTFVEGEPAPGGAPYEPMPVDVVDPDELVGPGWAVALGLTGGPLTLAAGIAALIVLRRPRASPTGFIVPQYVPPDGIGIMLASELIGRGSSALQAQIVSLAVRKRIRLLGFPVTDASTADYAVQLLDTAGLDSWDQAVVDALFGAGAAPGATRDLQRSGDSELADRLRPILAALPGTARSAGYFGEPTRSPRAGWWVLAAVVATIAGGVGAVFSGWIGVVTGAGVLMCGAIGIGLAAWAARRRDTFSPEGARIVDHLLGMKMYLELAEKDRFAVLQSATGAERIDTADGMQVVKLYEKLLPWAVAWGVEASWARELQVHLEQTGAELEWYAGTTPFEAYAFTSLLSGVTSGTSAPSASSSSSGSSWGGSGFSSFSGGSSGGGFSGGGGGGGGGGGR